MKKQIIVTELHRVLMNIYECTLQKADSEISDWYDRVMNGENPEKILYDEGLEPDYVLDILFYN